MRDLTEPRPVSYFAGLLAGDAGLFGAVERDLAVVLGPVAARSEVLPWNVSNYYQAEMGAGLLRRFLLFEPLSSPGQLASIKLKTREIESRYHRAPETGAGRLVNIDPGYIDQAKVVLASTKGAGHRIYLGSGIYAEATLYYVNGGFQPCHYTYADFLWPETLGFLAAARRRYLERLNAQRKPPGAS
ncbi:MAG TPA: DUF4416 family protein [Candidatus Eisenbacteria bacterium]|nr:DUF4416 family protein [Candidatus Eisenbacteria bacterium]